MSDFVEKLALAEKAAEDIYFARVNRELIESLHEQMRAEERSNRDTDQSGIVAAASEE
jgi:hypothetical protein